MIKVLVAEDELPLLRGISRLIEKINSDFTVVKMAKTGKEAMDYLEEYPVDVVFTDINMPVNKSFQCHIGQAREILPPSSLSIFPAQALPLPCYRRSKPLQ